jgi:hypothetical protein
VYFTRTNDTFRGWFHVQRSNGTLREDIVSSSFIGLVVNSADTAQAELEVTQSVQKPGLYRFDIPSSFLVTHGVGEYGISIEVDEDEPPRVMATLSKVLRVHVNDFDNLTVDVTASVDVNSIVSGVWDANAGGFNTPQTMGWLQNKISGLSSSLNLLSTSLGAVTISSGSIDSIVNAVWDEPASEHTATGTFGLSVQGLPDLQTIVSGVWDVSSSDHVLTGSTGKKLFDLSVHALEIHRILGLEPGFPVTVTPTSRSVGVLSQSFTGDPAVSITITRIS